MALQVLPRQPEPVGLQLLGNAIERGAADYAARRDQDRLRALALEDEARRRGERRADVDNDRTYQRTEVDRLRALQLEDEQRRRTQGLDDLNTRAAMEARLRALTQAAMLGIFDQRDLGNTEVEDAALTQLQARQATDTEFSDQQPKNAQARLAELSAAERDVASKMAAVEARLSAQPTVDQSQVENTAVQMATQANGGKLPSREQIQAAIPEALAVAQREAQVRWFQDKQDASVQYQILNSQLNTIRQQQANLTSTFKVAPSVSSLSPGPVGESPVPQAVPQGGNPLTGFLDQLNQRVPPPAPASSPNAQAVQDTTAALRTAPAGAAPLLRQSRTAMLAEEYGKLDAPVESTQQKLADVQRQLTSLQSGLTPWQRVNPAPLDIPVQAQGRMMTELLQTEAALQRQLAEDRAARTSGKTNLLQGVGAANTASGYTPFVPPSSGSVLSPR